MTSKFTKAMLFVSSYFPLWFVVFILYVKDHPFESAGLLTVGVSSVGWMLLYLKQVQKRNGVKVWIARARRCDHEALSYIVSYLLPFLALPAEGWQKTTAMGVFYLLLGFLYVNTDMIHINPTLLMANFRIYEIETEGGETRCVIARNRILSNSSMQLVDIDDGLAVEKYGNS